MQLVQQIVPISELRMNQAEVLAMTDKAPVILAQRSKPRAVLVSVAQWDAIANQLRNLQLLLEAKRIEAKTEPGGWVSEAELERMIVEKALVDVED